MSQSYTLNEFLQSTAQKDRPGQKFQLENSRTLEANLSNESLWIKLGSMVAYRGNLKFEREGMMDHGLGKFIKRAVTGEGTPLTRATGSGILYLADAAKHIMIVNLQNEAIHVNGSDLLAFEPSLTFDVKIIRKIAGMLAGGLFCVHLSGTGMVAMTSHGQPLTLNSSSSDPVMTDPNATVAWSGSMFPELKTDLSFRTFLGRGSGESLQMMFKETGFVIVQPNEEVPYTSSGS